MGFQCWFEPTWPWNDLEMTDWELDKLSRKINRCDPHRCTIWKWFLFRQDWIWPLMTSWVISGQIRSYKVMFDQSALTDYYPYQGQIPKFRCSKGYLYIYYKNHLFCTRTWTRVCSDMCGHLVYRASDPLNIFYLWYWIKIKRFF